MTVSPIILATVPTGPGNTFEAILTPIGKTFLRTLPTFLKKPLILAHALEASYGQTIDY